ncbi:MAG: hypothetical protein HY727_21060 [Candidatus Rokubacteria bacterium]|nr:hypothetical protein [Candidatus Rokubacteria bacterium]
MALSIRLIAVFLIAALLAGGPLAPSAAAQQASGDKGGDSYDISAGVVNIVGVPGHAIICALSGVTGFAFLLLTFGTQGRAFTAMVEEGCGGKWTVSGDDLRPAADDRKVPPFSWEKD